MAAVNKRAAAPATYSKDEKTNFPLLCETCLGPNPYVRMMRAEMDQECKICARPFTTFRWRPGRDARYKKTEICQTCSRLKNVCQTCLFDLTYGLPVQVRDAYGPAVEELIIPKSEVNREWFVQQQEKRFKEGGSSVYEQVPVAPLIDGPTGSLTTIGNAGLQGVQKLMKLARTSPYYKRNRPHVCSFFVKGECKRGEECPYLHEMPEEGPLSHQNIKDRYYGVNDPVAAKIMRAEQEREEERKKKLEDAQNKSGATYLVPENAGGSSSSSSSSSSSVPLPEGPEPASYFKPAATPGEVPIQYASQTSYWLGPTK